MRKDEKAVVTEYVGAISDGELVHISSRLNAKLQGDLAEVLYIVQRNDQMDDLLRSAADVEDFFDFLDFLGDQVSRECKKRGVGYASRN